MQTSRANIATVIALCLTTGCVARTTLPVPRARLPQAIHEGKVTVEDERGEAKEVRVSSVKVRPSSEDVELGLAPYHFWNAREPFEDIVGQWNHSPDWQVAEVTVVVPSRESNVRWYAMLGGSIVLLGGSTMMVVDSSDAFGTAAIASFTLFDLILMSAGGALFGGVWGVSQSPEYRLAD